ncbi:MAG: COX15/CtaA family protein [Acidimicrobiales bacterium]
MRVPTMSPALSTRAFRLALGALCLVVVTGAAVRLTGSGLGCSTWPTCHGNTLTPPLRFHSLIEFGNRMVAVLVTVATAAALLGAILRTPRRRDLIVLAAGTLGGVLAQAVLGGLTVLFKLAPGWVMAHFLLSMVLIAVGVALVHRDSQPAGVGVARVSREVILVSRLMVGLTAVVLGLGTVVTGAGPHSGSTGVARLPISARDAAELHSTLVMLLVGVTVATLLLLRPASAPPDVARRARTVLVVMVAQGAVGYTQYFTGVPAALVEVHIVGAVLVWLAVLRFHLSLHARVPDPAQAADDVTRTPEPTLAESASVLTSA